MNHINNFFILLFILYILFIILLLKKISIKIEKFENLDDKLANLLNPKYKKEKNTIPISNINLTNDINLTNNKPINHIKKQDTRIIYVIPSKTYNNNFKYIFYNKLHKYYMYLTGKINDNLPKIDLFNIKNENIGKLIYNEGSKYIFKIDFFENQFINIDFYNQYNESKIYMDNDDKFYYMKHMLKKEFNKNNFENNNEYEIFLFNKLIGKINYNRKIIVYEEYKKYLNIFAISYILLENLNFIKN
jgi:hypothetical protein